VRRETNLLRVWHLLREHGPMSPREVAARLDGMTVGNARATLQRMLKRKSVTAAGNSHRRIYTATKRKPHDMRGRTAGTKPNLDRGRVIGLHHLAAMRGRLIVPPAVHALDAAMNARRAA
jgi:hypothetical protein